jgi:undecaprenyl diphosphate synthase
MSYKEKLDLNRLPKHIAIIMDGNGRWAKQRGLSRSLGHQEGAVTVHEIVTAASNLGIDYITLYTFSTENWARPVDEVTALLALILKNLEEDLFQKNNASFRAIGDIDRLPQGLIDTVRYMEKATAKNTGTCLVLALSYSSKREISEAVRNIAVQVEKGLIKPDDIDEELINRTISTSFMPEPELLIRTGGELRLSNFLLWQAAYSELYFTDVYFPDFHEEEFYKAIVDYQGRQRRFGKTGEQVENKSNEQK